MPEPSSAPARTEIPAALAGRLFPEVSHEDLNLASSRSLVLARLLEDGDRDDLAWLFAVLPEPEIAAWVATFGGRSLSRRSAAYWQTVLGTPPGPVAAARADLWPL